MALRIAGHNIEMIAAALTLAGVDSLDGVQLLDGGVVAALHHPPINPAYPALLGNIADQKTLAALQRVLLNQYPGQFAVRLLRTVGTAAARAQILPLAEIAANPPDEATLLYVPALGQGASFEQFQEVIAHLRAPEGCPWDRQQTHSSLRQYLLEETYEVLETLDRGDITALQEELGDLLLQIVLHTQIAIDNGEFRMTDVLRHICDKMIRRHPHVWSDVAVQNADEVLVNWQVIKQREKAANGQANGSLLDGVPKTLPALMLAYQYQARAAKVGFDWDKIEGVRAKISEELDEVMAATTDAERAEELGDVLFVLVNWARWLNVEPESALRDTVAKFYRRFSFVEQRVRESGQPMTGYTLAELDVFWAEAKAKGL